MVELLDVLENNTSVGPYHPASIHQRHPVDNQLTASDGLLFPHFGLAGVSHNMHPGVLDDFGDMPSHCPEDSSAVELCVTLAHHGDDTV